MEKLCQCTYSATTDTPIAIRHQDVGEWHRVPIEGGELLRALLLFGPYRGRALWWDGEQVYKLDDGKFARIMAPSRIVR